MLPAWKRVSMNNEVFWMPYPNEVGATWRSNDEFPYPYNAKDGREDLERTNVQRSLRSGSFDGAWVSLRGADRDGFNPGGENNYFGFRCARDYDG